MTVTHKRTEKNHKINEAKNVDHCPIWLVTLTCSHLDAKMPKSHDSNPYGYLDTDLNTNV